jgi:hypothetical protein
VFLTFFTVADEVERLLQSLRRWLTLRLRRWMSEGGSRLG